MKMVGGIGVTLRLEGITKRFGDFTAVRDMNLTVAEGRVLGFLGSNGAGKTTTIRMIMSILLPDEGLISWRDQPVRYETSRSFGYLPEERGLYPKMKVGDQLVYLASLHGMSKADATASCKSKRIGISV
jgi:ABC-2 type transport system ATP-binding protein